VGCDFGRERLLARHQLPLALAELVLALAERLLALRERVRVAGDLTAVRGELRLELALRARRLRAGDLGEVLAQLRDPDDGRRVASVGRDRHARVARELLEEARALPQLVVAQRLGQHERDLPRRRIVEDERDREVHAAVEAVQVAPERGVAELRIGRDVDRAIDADGAEGPSGDRDVDGLEAGRAGAALVGRLLQLGVRSGLSLGIPRGHRDRDRYHTCPSVRIRIDGRSRSRSFASRRGRDPP
jgi:hypothetical protein